MFRRQIIAACAALALLTVPGCSTSSGSDRGEEAGNATQERAEGASGEKRSDEKRSTEGARGAPGRAMPESGDANKHALVIAIAEYPEQKTGWGPIAADNDIPLITEALGRHGFGRSNLTVVRDENADVEGMRSALEGLVDRVEPGDIVVIHYSGHGHQLPDEDRPVEEPDGYDEVFVPYGAPKDPPESYEGAKHMRDDEFGEILNRLRSKLGSDGHVMVSLDSCHSGTSTRGIVRARGASEPIGEPARGEYYDPDADEGVGMMEAGAATRGADEESAPFVVLSAARHDQLADEVQDESGTVVGSLSYALSHALGDVGPKTTYRGLFHDVQRLIRSELPDQKPQIAGDTDRKVLDGEARELPAHFGVASVGDGEIALDAGTVVGIQPGTRVAFHEPDADPDHSEPLVEGEVTRAESFWSLVPYDEAGVDAATLEKSWAYVEKFGHGDLRFGVQIHSSAQRAESRIRPVVDAIPVLSTDKREIDLVFFGNDDGTIELTTPDGRRTVAGPADPSDESFRSTITVGVRKYARVQLLTEKVDFPRSDALDFEVEIVPAKHEFAAGRCTGSKYLDPEDFEAPSGHLRFEKGQHFRVRIKNHSEKDAYITLLGIEPDGCIEQHFPTPHSTTGAGLMSKKKDEFVVPTCLAAAEPYGTDTFKVFATPDPVNFRPIAEAACGGTRGGGERLAKIRGEASSPLERLVTDSFLATSDSKQAQGIIEKRGTTGTGMAPREGATATASFEVVRPK